MLPPGCFPCQAAVARAARHVARVFRHPARRVAHHVLRHPGKVIIAACCAGAIGPGGGALPAAPESAPRAAYAAPLPAAAGWPEMPGWSVASGAAFGGGMGGVALSGNSPVLIPVYSEAPGAALIPTQPASARLPSSSTTHVTSIPEPASFALLLLPAGIVIAIRRRAT